MPSNDEIRTQEQQPVVLDPANIESQSSVKTGKPVQGTRERVPATLYYFTLESHYQRSIEQHPKFYLLPGGSSIRCARTREQLQRLMDNLDWSLFDEQDQQSDGLILCIDPKQTFPLIEPSRDQESSLPTLVFALPTQSIVETITVPQKSIRFQVPVGLQIRQSLSLKQMAKSVFQTTNGMPYILVLAALIGLVIAAFPKLFPSESASQWLAYFLSNAPLIATSFVVMLAMAGCIYLLLPLSRVNIQLTGDNEKLVQIRRVLGIVRPLDPGLDVVEAWALFAWGFVFLTSAVTGILLWYHYTPLPPIQFQIKPESKTDPYIILADGCIDLSPEGVMEIGVSLPPNVTHPSCTWSKAKAGSSIYGQADCQAVYWARDTTGEDRVMVEIYQSGRRLTAASFTVNVESEEP